MHTQHCGYHWPGSKAPGHQYSQCGLNIHRSGLIAYKSNDLLYRTLENKIPYRKKAPSCLRVNEISVSYFCCGILQSVKWFYYSVFFYWKVDCGYLLFSPHFHADITNFIFMNKRMELQLLWFMVKNAALIKDGPYIKSTVFFSYCWLGVHHISLSAVDYMSWLGRCLCPIWCIINENAG